MATILIVEDNPLIRELLTQQLEDEFALLTAENGRRGIEQANTHLPDLILMDLTMPVMDGWEAIAELRKKWATCRIPIVALTAVAEREEIQRALGLGADGYLRKPIEEAKLFAEIERLLAIHDLSARTSGIEWRHDILSEPPAAGEKKS